MFIVAVKNLLKSDSSANNLVSKSYFLLNENNKWGVIDNNAKIIVVNSIEEGVKISNLIAPEHLEVLVKEPKLYLDKILNAGSIFLGEYSPEPLGDYYAGPNHTLPTSGNARFSSPLSVDDFVKKSSYIMYSKEDLFKIKDEVITFARSEGLTAHANSIIKRFENE